jgi:hypothetical protein
MRQPRPELGCGATEKIRALISCEEILWRENKQEVFASDFFL